MPLLEKIVRCEAGTSESTFRGNCRAAAKEADPDEITVLDAGFHLPEIHLAELERYVVRMAANCTAPESFTRVQRTWGTPEIRRLIRPLARKHKGRTIAASQAQQQGRFGIQGTHHSLSHLASIVTVNTKVDEDNPTFTLMLFLTPCTRNP
ncbi:MAG: hypothetical protein R3A44_15195 [Caldilineaceae bacterium]